MTTRHRPALVLINDPVDEHVKAYLSALETQGDILYPADYNDLMAHVEPVKGLLAQHGIDFLLFERSDQVYDHVAIGPFIRALGAGYSTFSGIDPEHAAEQSVTCLRDYLEGRAPLDLPRAAQTPSQPDPAAETYSLIFDMEQLAGVRYGLPRLLSLLNRYQARATFFVTGFVDSVYPDALPALRDHGHEIGLHGQYHEYLAGHSLAEQTDMVAGMCDTFSRGGPVKGGNFIYRMDRLTVEAMAANGLHYYVEFREHQYRPFRYQQQSLVPQAVATESGLIWSVPVSVETYDRRWSVTRGMLRSALETGREQGWNHLNILMHPFRDGALANIGDLENMLDFLHQRQGYHPCPVAETLPPLQDVQPDSRVYYQLDHSLHAERATYEERISRLVAALRNAGKQPVLVLKGQADRKMYGVSPHLPRDGKSITHEDPLKWTWDTPYNGDPAEFEVGNPPAVASRLPRRASDLAGFAPEVLHRVRYYGKRMTGRS